MKGFVFRITVVAATLALAGLAFAADAERAPGDLDEAEWLAILETSEDWADIHEAFNALRQIGTAKSVPALAARLTDEKLSNLARYALEPMPYAEAGQALRNALGDATGMPRVGIITSLGVRHDVLAVPLLIPMLDEQWGGDDPAALDASVAAAGALGRIATREAVEALRDATISSSGWLRTVAAEGLLAAAERYASIGRQADAAAIYRELNEADVAPHIQMGAFRGLVLTQPDEAPELVLAALAGGAPVIRGFAAELVAETRGTEAARRYAAALAALPAEGQTALLRGLAKRGDSAVRPEVARLAAAGQGQPQLAALRALGALGDAADVPMLVERLASDDAEVAAAARESLSALQGTGVDAALAATLSDAIPAVRTQVLALLAGRRAELALPMAANYMNDAEESVRIAALESLAAAGGPDQVPTVLAALERAAASAERTAAAQTLRDLAARGGDAALGLALDAMDGATPEVQAAILGAVSQVGGPRALQAVVDALGAADEAVRTEAARQLSNWPTTDAAPHLLELVRSEDAGRRRLGLEGYVRLAREEASLERREEMLTAAMNLAERTEDKWLVISAWGTVPTAAALNALLPLLDEPEIQNEAAAAVLSVARGLARAGGEHRTLLRDALSQVVDKCSNEAIRARAQQALDAVTPEPAA